MSDKFKRIFYVFNCGCRVEEEKRLRYRIKTESKDTTQYRCPDHKHDDTGIVGYILECIDCGKHFFSEKNSQRCDKCQTKNKKKVFAQNQKNFRDRKRGSKPIVIRKNDTFKKLIDGKKDGIACEFFGGICGKICVEPEVYCRARKSKTKTAA